MNDDELRDALRGALPEPPDASGWAQEARRRHRRRTRALATAGVAVVLTAVIGTLQWRANTPTDVAVPAPQPSVPSAPTPASTTVEGVGMPDACRGLAPSKKLTEVPSGVTRLRLCPTGPFAPLFVAPLDALEGEGVSHVLQTLDQQTRLRSDGVCTTELGTEFLLVAESDGRPAEPMLLQLYSCGRVGPAGAPRFRSDKVLAAFIDELGRQRERIDRPAVVRTGKLCPATHSLASVMPFDVAAATGGRFCRYSTSMTAKPKESVLSADDLAAITADITQHSAAFEALPCPSPPQRPNRILLTDDNGEVLELTASCANRWVYTPKFLLLERGQLGWSQGDLGAKQWVPSKKIAARLAELTAG